MMKEIRMIRPEWTEANPVYSDVKLDEDELLMDLEMDGLMAIPFNMTIVLPDGNEVDVVLVMRSLLAHWGELKDGMNDQDMYGVVLEHLQ